MVRTRYYLVVGTVSMKRENDFFTDPNSPLKNGSREIGSAVPVPPERDKLFLLVQLI